MRSGPNQASSRLRRFWRRLIGAVAIYALAMQPLLLTVAGSQLAQAALLDDAQLSQLCLHNADGSPVAPADQPKFPAHQHCLQCFSGAFHLLDGPRPVAVELVDRKFHKLPQSGRTFRLPSSSQYSVARPRGPPLSA
jgi:hypothetical protein